MNLVDCTTRLPTIPGAYRVLVKHPLALHRAVESGITWNGTSWEGAALDEKVVSWVDTAPPAAVIYSSVQPPAEAAPESYSIFLTGYADDKMIAVIKVVREIMGLGLGESKALVMGSPAAPKVLKTLPAGEAKNLNDKLLAAGAKTLMEAA